MKNAALLLAALAIVCLPGHAHAAIVGPAGYSNDFGSQPVATDWATFSRPGGAGDGYEMDGDVNANIVAGGVTTPVGQGTGTPPAAVGTAVWHSTAFYLQTRPT